MPGEQSLQEWGAKKAADAAAVAARDLAAESRKDKPIAWKVVGVVACFGLACALIYFLVKDSRDGHAMTAEEYIAANKDRDEKVAAVRLDLQTMTQRVASALDSIGSMKSAQDAIGRDVKDSESRLRSEIQGTNARIDRVLEAVNKSK